MATKPIPKPRSLLTDNRPIPAPRRIPPTLPPARSSSPTSESSQSEKSDDLKSTGTNESQRGNHEFFRSLSTSSRQLKEEISEKMTVKGRAMISSTRNASIRLERSVKNLLTRRLSSLNQDDVSQAGAKKLKDPVEEDRCVSMPADDIFSSISFYSPLSGNLRSVKNEEDLSDARHSPPPPVYPPPPLPDESIYDELQSVISGSSGRYDTLSSTVSDKVERDFPESFNLLSLARNQDSDSDQSLNLSDINVSLSQDKSETSRKLARSDSWTFYDTTPSAKPETIDEIDKVSSIEEESLEKSCERGVSTIDRTSYASNESHASIQNSIYENLLPPKVESWQPSLTSPSDTRQQSSKSLLFEFDPFARTPDENVYSNYENNDLMLLEALLATNDSSSRASSTLELHESIDVEEEHEEEDPTHPGVSLTPPEPPKRFDSLPKNEYDEVEGVEQPDKTVSSKNPPLLPKLAHLVTKKQPAVPPRKPTLKNPVDNSSLTSSKPAVSATTTATPVNNVEGNVTSPSSGVRIAEDHRKVSVIQKLRKLRQESAVHAIKPNVISFVKTGSKFLSRTREHIGESIPRSPRMERPKVNAPHNQVTHRGMVYRSGVGIERAKDLVPRAAVLMDRKLSFYTDKSMSTLKEAAELEAIHSIHLLQDVKTMNGETVHCIAINGEYRPAVHVFYAKSVAERRIWAQRILEATTPVFPTKYTAEFTKAGWTYLKEGVTGTWFSAWLLLQQRNLIYTKSSEPAFAVNFEQVDLRKARCIVLREQEGPISGCGLVPVVVVDAGGSGALHIATPAKNEALAWRHALYQAATNCGPALDQQQITQDNVPVILDKCVNFIYAHGMMSEGIYRRSGSSSAVVRLLEAFRKDAWATQITRNSYTEHDVATVLRRFLRDLPDPLFPANIHDRLCLAVESTSEENRVATYQKLLSILNPVTSATLRRILAHLHGLSQQSARNLMTVENLSAVWGPTLMHAGENSAEEWNRAETKVIGDLIRLYPKLYQLSPAELAKEAKMLEVLEKHHVSNNGPRAAPSGDLKMWIYILSPNGECVNVTIGPQKTAFDVCRELGEKANLPAHELCLEEYTLSGALERPLHHNERVLETAARWGYWDPEDRKDNILVLKKDRLYKDIVPLVKPPITTSGELKFADTRTKNLRTYHFEFNQAKLCCYKDKVYSVKLHEWKIEDIIWYLGHEPKRNPQMGWSITFIMKNKKPTRCKDSPYFGNTLAGTSKDDQYRWLAAMLFGEYQLNLRPSAVNLMDP
ncbi:arf-GAP with Rho-GAP domain, ANK repeat and PH domain-containing protein 1 [Odontomachus brunneus]|uniref:arf-GAP with Rho-GAP domain, ANK repeat and PH domain-containing protein 1 n=1 Tax=Odontomachus brunneus TaxID=486640 RepID=UPI0013F26B95|nr:arf-GAP with Rho-GAP domain, ANK repeat and PH domain-containing protein 1 [Odontomachus brunneus]XP_032673779.1 arf-GAP with Rho-GAP domain, ANK repeat and PH domain-containing protein 1 [Odontomachus brunneus]XP_032673780.1 arf-GAP with Rho-GAP domain, ANK repeat and PH domain-containing protein 1 [Odontomachus brunneus]XP_032673782.1 arf-GAP with Rho-GAP domain, ANK repeat and PH domain-containing protein 1 [Odontomachus brunneus]XP_032673783.1 arf-GAP with Rho-GAP domain, ANK repeat and 